MSTRPPGVSRSAHILKQLCMSVYTQAMRPNNFNTQAKSLTGFGPASAADKYFKSVDPKVSSLSDKHLLECELFSFVRIKPRACTSTFTARPLCWRRRVRGARRMATQSRRKARSVKNVNIVKKIKFNPFTSGDVCQVLSERRSETSVGEFVR